MKIVMAPKKNDDGQIHFQFRSDGKVFDIFVSPGCANPFVQVNRSASNDVSVCEATDFANFQD